MATDVTYSVKGSCYFTKRTSAYGFTAKGGNNGESHNHIDVGNFIIARNNKQIIADIGACPYGEGYHTDKRYTYFNPSAYAHNLPIFDGIGEDSIARDDVFVEYDWEKQRAYLDITNGYGIDFLKKAERVFDFEENRITMRDKYSFTKETEVTERFISIIEPQIVGDAVVIDDVRLVNCYGIVPQITVKETEKHLGGFYNVYILDYVLPKGKNEFEITFEM